MTQQMSKDRIRTEVEQTQMREVQEDYARHLRDKDWVEAEVPASQFGRILHFGKLGINLTSKLSMTALGTAFDRQAAVDLVARNLCKMRGAALKLGQMLSIQDQSVLPSAITESLKHLSNSANIMPGSQRDRVLLQNWGPDWEGKVSYLNPKPFAAASIGQVHEAVIQGKKVAVKIQYPGVSKSIKSDLTNLKYLAKMTGVFPKGIFIENIIQVMQGELQEECDYLLEASKQKTFSNLLQESVHSDDQFISATDNFHVPYVHDELTTRNILVTELVSGVPLDRVKLLPQRVRDSIGRRLLKLSLLELFHFRFVQSDPNFGNFLYDVNNDTINLLDFGATREYDAQFVKQYLELVLAASDKDIPALVNVSKKLGFLDGMVHSLLSFPHMFCR